MKEIARYLEKFQADIAKSQLDASGIWAVVMTDNEGGMAPHLSFVTGVRLMVRPEDEAAAREILTELEEHPVPVESPEEEESSFKEAAALQQKVKTALAAAVLSLVVLPVFANIWSFAQLLQLPPQSSLPANLRSMVRLAYAINGLVLLLAALIIHSIFVA